MAEAISCAPSLAVACDKPLGSPACTDWQSLKLGRKNEGGPLTTCLCGPLCSLPVICLLDTCPVPGAGQGPPGRSSQQWKES